MHQHRIDFRIVSEFSGIPRGSGNSGWEEAEQAIGGACEEDEAAEEFDTVLFQGTTLSYGHGSLLPPSKNSIQDFQEFAADEVNLNSGS